MGEFQQNAYSSTRRQLTFLEFTTSTEKELKPNLITNLAPIINKEVINFSQ